MALERCKRRESYSNSDEPRESPWYVVFPIYFQNTCHSQLVASLRSAPRPLLTPLNHGCSFTPSAPSLVATSLLSKPLMIPCVCFISCFDVP